jgi:hypothetical protein
MILRPVRFCSTLIGALVFAACQGGGSPTAALTPPDPQPPAAVRQVRVNPQDSRQQLLYVTSAVPYFFSAYALPLHDGDAAIVTKTGVNEPVPIVDDGRNLYVGSFDDGTISTFPIPLDSSRGFPQPGALSRKNYVVPRSGPHPVGLPGLPGANGDGVPSGLGDLSGLAVFRGRLYVAGAGPMSEEVFEYKLPLVAGEQPSGSLAFAPFDFLAIAARAGTLYVASTSLGTVGAYRLPLGNDQAPQYTIETVPQQGDGAVGVAVDRNSRHLYVSLFSLGNVEEFALPYHPGESVRTIDVKSDSGGGLPYGVAVKEKHLFVTAGFAVLAYQLPLTSHSTPDATVPFNGDASGVTAGL